MNSESNVYHYDCKKEKEHCSTILKCSGSSGLISVPATTPATPLVLATVPVGIPKWCNNPCVNIEFASNVEVVSGTEGATINIIVTIFKNCPYNLRVPIASYSYGSSALLASASTFSFFVCDCNTCQSNECCTYSAEITFSSAIGTVATLNNATLSAIIASSDCSC